MPPSHVEKPGDAVAAAANGDRQVVAAREADGRDHVRRAGAADDQRRAPAVVCPVPDPARLRIPIVGRGQDLASGGIPQLLHGGFAEHGSKRFRHVVLPFFERVDEVLTEAPLRELCGTLASASICLSTAATPSVSREAA